MNTKIPRILAIVDGGVVQQIICDGAIDLIMADFDNIQEGDPFNPEPCRHEPISPEEFDAIIADTIEEAAPYAPGAEVKA